MKKTLLLALFICFINIQFAQVSQDTLFGYKSDTFWAKSKFPHLLMNKILGEQTNVVWATGNHTASSVPLGVVGPEKYTSQFKGIIQNVKIAEILKQAVSDKMNVILVIGDGMGINHMTLPVYKNIALKNNKETYFEKIMREGETGIVLTHPHGEVVTSSAAASTAIACGTKTLVGMVGIDAEGTRLESILDVAEKNNLGTGLITEASLTDGTPAGFYGHSSSRHTYTDLARQLIMDNEIEILFGGGGELFAPKGKKLSNNKYFKDINPGLDAPSIRKDDLNLLEEAENKGYKLVGNKAGLDKISADEDKVLGIFSAHGLNATIDRDNENTGEPSLVDLSQKGIEVLSSKENPYFLMIEAARIDWESHDNDLGAVHLAVNEMNDVLEVCYNEYKKNPEKTLLVFTADHETGGLAIAYTKLPRGERPAWNLKSGDRYEKTKNNVSFEQFLKFDKQKSSIYKLFRGAESAEDLYEKLNDNFEFEVSKKEAEILFELISGYRKSK
ncbi:MAG: alkaline phosphatase [Rhodothermaceae bacterium]